MPVNLRKRTLFLRTWYADATEIVGSVDALAERSARANVVETGEKNWFR